MALLGGRSARGGRLVPAGRSPAADDPRPDALNGKGKSVRGSNVLVLGVAYKKDIDDMMSDKGLEWAGTSNMNVNVNGNNAVVTGVYHTKGKDAQGMAYDRKVRYIDTWVKRDGTWQIWTSQGTPMPAKEVIAQQ